MVSLQGMVRLLVSIGRSSIRRLSAGLISLTLALCLSAGSTQAKNDVADMQQVISEQLDAFAQDDDARAFSYASSSIQRGFSSAEAFGKMVREQYPAVYEAATVRFREQVPHPGFVIQRVLLVGPDGRYWDAYYRMEQQDDEWRIGGVVLKRSELGI